MDFKALWEKNKILFFILIPLILIVKFRDILISLIVSGGKKALEDAQKKDGELAATEVNANNQANKLVEDAKKLAENKTPVDEDWYKK